MQTSQASISRAVADLEHTVGAKLLLRTRHGVQPSVLGRRVLEHARRLLAEVKLIQGLGEHIAGDLRVGFSWAVFGRLTTPIQRRWQAGHGSGTFVQSSTPTAGLLEGEVDFAVLRRSPLRHLPHRDRGPVRSDPATAADHIFGYTILNDFSARDLQRREMKVNLGPAKGKDFGSALGP